MDEYEWHVNLPLQLELADPLTMRISSVRCLKHSETSCWTA